MSSTSSFQTLLNTYRHAAVSEREKGTYFEELCCLYFRNEASYKDLYSDVWTYKDWASLQTEMGISGKDTGIDLVARTQGTGEFHAIQCKFFAEEYRVQKSDIDSFFTASGKKYFTHRIIVTTTNNWNEHAEDALQNQHPPVTKIDLYDLENSQIDWQAYQANQAKSVTLKQKKTLRDHQTMAKNAVAAGLKDADRGKLIMACGTGKTFTSLKIAEELAGKGKRVLFLVPSLSLLSQTLSEWTQESSTPLHSFAVCSDSDVGKKRKAEDDNVQTFTHELRYPATTEPSRLALEMTKRHDAEHMSVVFSTYHSIESISTAQKEHHLADFDLIICDEAHRTTGATFDDESESMFVKVHDSDFIKANKRLYMTATPRIFGEKAKAVAEKDNTTICSMDDEALYGKELYVISFSEAVKRDLLADYKVIVLAVDEAHVNTRLLKLLDDANNSLKVDDAAKIIGCWKALSKQDTQDDLVNDPDPMRRAVAFCQVINPNPKAKSHKVSSVNIADMFSAVVEAYQEHEEVFDTDNAPAALRLKCEAKHVDGSMNASVKEAKLQWLKADTPANTCRILSNVRCLSEGVDVPALDAVLFLTPRNSQVDVVQSVGRVMRKAEGKKRGYVILPVVIPQKMQAHEALNDNVTFKVVWQVLQALRSHDDRFDSMVNKMDLELNPNILSKMEVIAVTDKINHKPRTDNKADKDQTNKKKNKSRSAARGQSIGQDTETNQQQQSEIEFEIGEIERAIYAKVVQKCGNRSHWEDWANDISKIAKTHIGRIHAILNVPDNTDEIAAFKNFTKELRDDLNGAISDDDVIEMLAQHLITKPVFDALFEGYSFAKNNPMSLAMQAVLDTLHKHNIQKEADTLQSFYDSVKMRANGIDSAQAKQKIIVELYDKFFKNAFPRMTEKLGIVYTPVEVVDFIIHSVNDVLQSEFDLHLGSKGVHIIDPFTGTGTFITRLLQSGLISQAELEYKYKNEIHANEIVLLAYYIAAINIESVYHTLAGGKYLPFDGICLTDTFALHEPKQYQDGEKVESNKSRRLKQKKLDIRVIIGNPPYSSGQSSANDNNANVEYPVLDARIRSTYAAHSKATSTKNLMDSYIRAIRWASDRLGDSGVMGFVSGSGFTEKPAMDGMRKCLAEEFSSIHVLNLRGDIRKNMLSKGKAREGQNVFGSGSMTGISITLFVKNPNAVKNGRILYHNIGDDLSKDVKLEKLTKFKGINGINDHGGWEHITPDQHHDWIGQRDNSFEEFICLGDKKNKTSITVFENFSLGVATSRDAWCYNFSKKKLTSNMQSMIAFYNTEVTRYQVACNSLAKENHPNIDNFIDYDQSKISWNDSLKIDVTRFNHHTLDETVIAGSLFRPFTKQNLYFNKNFNQRRYQMPRIFPDTSVQNRVICVSGVGARSGFCALMMDHISSLDTIEKGQCFPLYLYQSTTTDNEVDDVLQGDIFDAPKDQPFTLTADGTYSIKDGISDAGLGHFQAAYPNHLISKEDLFYYIYGLLHSEEYKDKYADNLSKELPRIPAVKTIVDFWAFSKAGRALAELHLNYETVAKYPVEFEGGALLMTEYSDEDFYVTQMKYGKIGKDKDKTTVIYNHKITMKNIPMDAYEYIVNGKPALDWVMERQCVSTHKDSGIVNDANHWAIETMNNAAYPLDLFQRVITVSLETMKIVRALPKLDF